MTYADTAVIRANLEAMRAQQERLRFTSGTTNANAATVDFGLVWERRKARRKLRKRAAAAMAKPGSYYTPELGRREIDYSRGTDQPRSFRSIRRRLDRLAAKVKIDVVEKKEAP